MLTLVWFTVGSGILLLLSNGCYDVRGEAGPPLQVSPQEVWAVFENLWANLCQIRVLSSDMGMEESQALLSFIHASQIVSITAHLDTRDLVQCFSQPEYRYWPMERTVAEEQCNPLYSPSPLHVTTSTIQTTAPRQCKESDHQQMYSRPSHQRGPSHSNVNTERQHEATQPAGSEAGSEAGAMAGSEADRGGLRGGLGRRMRRAPWRPVSRLPGRTSDRFQSVTSYGWNRRDHYGGFRRAPVTTQLVTR
ncbi:uncharacterized protein LOC132468595 [Gadus macrocephalus]|uniref:uncharacterized protein LOC132468595 n=1 Tax=Gadus macrocephalus TaxID=80720 RepID=UPI0028CBAF1B|nr:uncharacterized protein LOC132468595 [Gadus macrocephalus]